MADVHPPLPGMPPRTILVRVRPRVVGGLFKVSWWPEPEDFALDPDGVDVLGSRTVDGDGLVVLLGSVGQVALDIFGRGPARLSK